MLPVVEAQAANNEPTAIKTRKRTIILTPTFPLLAEYTGNSASREAFPFTDR
jgi:hypothetical protein